MVPTFAELGVPFPLFEADTAEASDYVGPAICALCGAERTPSFSTRTIVLPCPHCGAKNGLPVNARNDTACQACGRIVPLPSLSRDEYGRVLVCYACLRAGNAALAKDTVLGYVGWDEATAGQTMPSPDPSPSQLWISDGKDIVGSSPSANVSPYGFERVFISRGGALVGAPEDQWMDWFATRVPSEMLFELLRTPVYGTWQGEQWQFCCQHPMIYIGTWTPRDFDAYAPDGNGRALFNEVVSDADDLLWRECYDAQGIYVFRCAHCGRHKAHWDQA